MANSNVQSSRDYCDTKQPSSVPEISAPSSIMIPVFNRHPEQVDLLGSALSQLFNTKKLTKAGSSFHVDFDSRGTIPKGLHDFSGLEKWSGSVISVSGIALHPAKYDNGAGVKDSITTETGGAVILWTDNASATHAYEVPYASIEVQTGHGDRVEGVKESILRIRSGRDDDLRVSPWIRAKEKKPMMYIGGAAIWEWSCAGDESASTA
jgi:hypothetical protein